MVEQGDRATAEALAATSLAGWAEIIHAPPGWPRNKPRALNLALPLARGSVLVVYDAEDEPDPDQLLMAVAAFRALPRSVACLQARLTIDNTGDSWLARGIR